MIRLSAFADEADASFDGQLAALKRNGIEYIEIRGLDGTNVSDISEEKAVEYAERLAASGIKVWSIGSPIGKIKISDDTDAHLDKLRHVCRLANIFGTDKIRMFSFYEAYGESERVFALLSEMVKIASEYGIKLCHENEKRIYGDTLERVLEISERVKGLYFIYDPANFIEVGEDPKSTLASLHGMSEYFHIKDVISATGQLVPAGYGDGRIGELIDMIGERDKVLTIEPHLKVFKGYSEIDDTEMKNKFHYASNGEAFDAAVSALKAVIESKGYKLTDGGYVR
jgi:sugar phosphate isomerase/epimerase